MKVFALSMFGVVAAMSVASSTVDGALSKHLAKLKEAADAHARILNEFLASEGGLSLASDPAAPCEPAKPTTGLVTNSLKNVSVQPSCGVQSGGRGLTPEDEWRRMFPNKPGYSRP